MHQQIIGAERLKQQAAEHAVGLLELEMIVGLGHGSTVLHAVRCLADRLRTAQLTDIQCIPCSTEIETEARQLGIPLTTLKDHPVCDLTIDGADEVNPDWDLIKGAGGALLKEKILAQASLREVIIVDESKLVSRLGTLRPVPVEVAPFGARAQFEFLATIGAKTTTRLTDDGSPYLTENGNHILDAKFESIDDPNDLANTLDARAGVIAHGLFVGLVTDVIVAGVEGIRHLQRFP